MTLKYNQIQITKTVLFVACCIFISSCRGNKPKWKPEYFFF